MSWSRMEISEEIKVDLQEVDNFSQFVKSGKLNNKNLHNFHIQKVEFNDIHLKNFKFESVSLFESNFENTAFSDGECESLKMDGSIFKNVTFKNIRFKNTSFSSWYNDRKSFFENVIFENCMFDEVDIDELHDSHITFINSNANHLSVSGRKIKMIIKNTNFTDSRFNIEFSEDLVIDGGKTVHLRLEKSKMHNLIINKVKNLNVSFCGDASDVLIHVDIGFVGLGGNIASSRILFNQKGHVKLGAGLKHVYIYYPKDAADNSLFLLNSKITNLEVHHLNADDLRMIESEIGYFKIYGGNIEATRLLESTIGELKLHDVYFKNKIQMDGLKVGMLHIINGSRKNKNKEDSAYGAVVQTLILEKSGTPRWTRENIKDQHILDAL